jgi:hypothetical protein
MSTEAPNPQQFIIVEVKQKVLVPIPENWPGMTNAERKQYVDDYMRGKLPGGGENPTKH